MEIAISSLGVALVIGMVCSAWIVSIDLKAIRNELREQRQYLNHAHIVRSVSHAEGKETPC